MDENALECYRQRYETWRHLDGLRYRTIQMGIGAFGAVVAADGIADAKPLPWVWLALSVFLFLQWQVLTKVNDGIVANGNALRRFGEDVGDTDLPNTSNRKGSVFYYAEWLFFALGSASFAFWLLIILDRSAS